MSRPPTFSRRRQGHHPRNDKVVVARVRRVVGQAAGIGMARRRDQLRAERRTDARIRGDRVVVGRAAPMGPLVGACGPLAVKDHILTGEESSVNVLPAYPRQAG